MQTFPNAYDIGKMQKCKVSILETFRQLKIELYFSVEKSHYEYLSYLYLKTKKRNRFAKRSNQKYPGVICLTCLYTKKIALRLKTTQHHAICIRTWMG